MSKHTVSADGGAMPAQGLQNRRVVLSCITASIGALLAIGDVAATAAAPPIGDAEIITLSGEIIRRCDAVEKFSAERIEPLNEHFEHLLHDDPRAWAVRWAEACAYAKTSGRDAVIDELEDFDRQTDHLFARMMAIPATTQSGRAAKVHALLVHSMPGEWRGPGNEMEVGEEQARALLCEFAGMSVDELAAI